MDESLNCADNSDPAVYQQKGGVRPVCEVQQDVVPARVQDDEPEVGEAKYSGTIANVGDHFFWLGRIPGIRPSDVIADCRKNDVHKPYVQDEKSLSSSRYNGKTHDWYCMVSAKDWGINTIGVEPADKSLWHG